MTKKIFIIAGENSGDAIGAKLMRALKKQSGESLEFSGIGGHEMAGEGLSSLFPMQELSIMGMAELIPHIPNILYRINQTVEKIREINPDILVTIDSPGFTFRVAEKLRQTAFKKLHIVAPSVWAWKPHRAAKIAKLYDHLLAFLPFEPPYFIKEGLACTYIGHPVTEEEFDKKKKAELKNKYNIASEAPILAVMPGSRSSEIKPLLPIFREAIILLARKFRNLHVAMLATPQFEKTINENVKHWQVRYSVITDRNDKKSAMAGADVALVKSGTSTMEVAIAKTPMVITYKVNPISAYLARRMLKIKYANLINIILDREVIPELLQERCTPELITSELTKLLTNPRTRDKQIKECGPVLEQLGLGDKNTPSEKAAKIILEMIN